jgi:hypothetical protein
MANDLFSALRTYLSKVGSGEKSPQELAAALNQWAKESGEAIKTRIEEEVEKSVKRMGFAEKREIELLRKEVAALSKRIDSIASKKSGSNPASKKDAESTKNSKPKGARKANAKDRVTASGKAKKK